MEPQERSPEAVVVVQTLAQPLALAALVKSSSQFSQLNRGLT
jgi:hypothetical protein